MVFGDGYVVDVKPNWRMDHPALVQVASTGRNGRSHWVEVRSAGSGRVVLVCGCEADAVRWTRCQSHARGIYLRVGGAG